jgi:microcystin degradation protein MlrC
MARIAIGCFAQESQSFSPIAGSWLHFGPQELARGQELVERFSGTNTEMGGALDFAAKHTIEVVPLLSACAAASAGPMRAEVFAAIHDELLERLRHAGPVDGVFLVLHGAMVTEDHDDATGEVLRAFRTALGPDVPLVGTLDLHANVTQTMVNQATALVGYHTAPHVDQRETALRGMAILEGAIAGHIRPVCALRRLPMLLPGETAITTEGGYAEVMSQAEDLMQRSGIVDVSVFSVQPWLDVYDVGCSVLVIADDAPGLAAQGADQLAEAFWHRRRDFEVPVVSTAHAIRRALTSEAHPFVLADSADAPSSGAPGDSTVVLKALLEARPAADCLLNIVDPAAVDRMVQAGVGRDVMVEVGASSGTRLYTPAVVTGRVRLISDGDFVQKGPGFHGEVLHRGRTVVLQIDRVQLVVMERPTRQWDPELYRSVGLEPCDSQITVVKSPAAFRAAYEPLAAEVLILDAPGVCSPNLRPLPFRHVRRPLYPLDEHAEWPG